VTVGVVLQNRFIDHLDPYDALAISRQQLFVKKQVEFTEL
jgi:hypothetical protein